MMHFEIAKGMTPRMYTNYEVDGDYLFVDSYEIDAFGEENKFLNNEVKNINIGTTEIQSEEKKCDC